jgi:hypothetical protein
MATNPSPVRQTGFATTPVSAAHMPAAQLSAAQASAGLGTAVRVISRILGNAASTVLRHAYPGPDRRNGGGTGMTGNADTQAQLQFPSRVTLLGAWLAAHEDGRGSNDLMRLKLHWQSNPDLSLTAAHQAVACGFEHYLNCLHPDDIDIELRNIKHQLLERTPVCLTQVNMRLDNLLMRPVWVRREMQFCPANGELLAIKLMIGADFP